MDCPPGNRLFRPPSDRLSVSVRSVRSCPYPIVWAGMGQWRTAVVNCCSGKRERVRYGQRGLFCGFADPKMKQPAKSSDATASSITPDLFLFSRRGRWRRPLETIHHPDYSISESRDLEVDQGSHLTHLRASAFLCGLRGKRVIPIRAGLP